MIRNLKCLMFYCNMMKSANYSGKESCHCEVCEYFNER